MSRRPTSGSAAAASSAPPAIPLDLLPEAALLFDPNAQLAGQNRLADSIFGPRAPGGNSGVASALADLESFRRWHVSGISDLFTGRLEARRSNGVPITVGVNARRTPDGGALCLLHEHDRDQVASEAQRYFDAAFDAAPIGMALFNTDGEYVRVNAALSRFLGRSEAELLGSRDQEFTHPDDRQADVDAAWRILRGEISTWQCEKRFIRPDGEVVWAMANLAFLRDAEGNPLSWMGQFQDVTERKLSEELLERQRRKLAEAQSLARMGSWEWDIASNRIEWSDELCRIYGVEPGTAIDFESLLARVYEQDRDLMQRVVGEAYKTGEPFAFEHRIVRPDGSVRVLYGRGEVAAGPDGAPLRMLGTGQDISDLKAAYRAVEESERHTRQIIESAQDAFVAIDRDGRIVDWNPAAETTFGWSRAEAIGMDLVESIVPELRRPDLGSRLQEMIGKRRELRALHRDGHEIPIEFTISAIESASGPTFNAFLRDRTTQLRAEAAIADARDAAIEASRLKSNFLANMSHEIRTPMNAVIGMTGLLLDSDLTPEQTEYASTVRTASEALLEIINDILDFSKIEAGKLRLEPTTFEIPKLVEEVASIMAPAVREKGLRLTTSVDPDVASQVVGDPGRLRQILINLLGNAVKFTDTGHVALCLKPAAGRVRFEITDTGIGIPEAAQAQLFQAFHQVDSSLTRSHGGTGLGLVISKQLVGLMEGDIGVRSRAGEGSTFWFDVPLPAATRIHAPAVEPRLVQVGAGARILVAEDNVVNQLVTRTMLDKLGYRAEVVASGGEAIAALSEDSYAAVLMDCQMPAMDGYDATREIRRRQGAGLHTPVIAMTAGAMNGDRERCLAAGMDDYISKPVRTEELGRVLQLWVGGDRRPLGKTAG
ncbi:MAG TPA: PAS domain S-box protein [Actinomycetota bacterium]|nr:PAS domain S-box protein [Actinomycetota bacterium]